MQQKLPDILLKVRRDRKKSQEVIGELLGVDKTTYGRYENGTVEIGFNQVVTLASYYKMTLDELYNYGNPDFRVAEPKAVYQQRWGVPITVTLDGTDETLKMWLTRLSAMNSAI